MLEPAVITPPAFTVARPRAGEYAPYYERYISLIEGDDILNTLDQQRREMMLLISCRDDEDGDFRYAPEKWSAKEVLGHICDTERVFAYRSLTFARSDSTALPGFDQDPWVKNANHANIPMKELAEEFVSVRRSTIHFFRHLDPAAWMRRGTANNNPITVRALAYLIAGHTEHHLEILRSRYLSE